MASRQIIVPGAFPSRDANGRVLPAKLRFFLPGTSTPAVVYTDATLATPLAFPIISDDAGRWPAIWAEEETYFDVAWSTLATDAFVAGFANVRPLDDALLASATLSQLAADKAAVSAASAADSATEAATTLADVQTFLEPFGDIAAAATAAEVAADTATTAATAAAASALSIDVPALLQGMVESAQFQTLAYANTVNWDTTTGPNGLAGYNASVTITGNPIMTAPTDLRDGITYSLELIQGGGGSHIPTWDTIFDFRAQGLPILSTTTGKADLLYFQYIARTGKLGLIGYSRDAG